MGMSGRHGPGPGPGPGAEGRGPGPAGVPHAWLGSGLGGRGRSGPGEALPGWGPAGISAPRPALSRFGGWGGFHAFNSKDLGRKKKTALLSGKLAFLVVFDFGVRRRGRGAGRRRTGRAEPGCRLGQARAGAGGLRHACGAVGSDLVLTARTEGPALEVIGVPAEISSRK